MVVADEPRVVVDPAEVSIESVGTDTDADVEDETTGTLELGGVELAWPPPHAVSVNPTATSKPVVVVRVLNMC